MESSHSQQDRDSPVHTVASFYYWQNLIDLTDSSRQNYKDLAHVIKDKLRDINDTKDEVSQLKADVAGLYQPFFIITSIWIDSNQDIGLLTIGQVTPNSSPLTCQIWCRVDWLTCNSSYRLVKQKRQLVSRERSTWSFHQARYSIRTKVNLHVFNSIKIKINVILNTL